MWVAPACGISQLFLYSERNNQSLTQLLRIDRTIDMDDSVIR